LDDKPDNRFVNVKFRSDLRGWLTLFVQQLDDCDQITVIVVVILR